MTVLWQMLKYHVVVNDFWFCTQEVGDRAKVVLYTDGQVHAYDNTFLVKSNADLPVAMVEMAQSAVHYGNPMSTVDFVLAHWRNGKPMEPRECYESLVQGSLSFFNNRR